MKHLGAGHAPTRKPCCRKENRAMRPIYGCPEKFRESLATPTATFSKLLMGFCCNRSYHRMKKIKARLENSFEKNLGFLGFYKNLKTSKVQNVGFLVFFIFWSNFMQIILNFIF